MEYCARSTTRPRLEFYTPTILVSQLPCDRQSQSAATSSILTCGIQPVEWAEYRFQLILRDIHPDTVFESGAIDRLGKISGLESDDIPTGCLRAASCRQHDDILSKSAIMAECILQFVLSFDFGRWI